MEKNEALQAGTKKWNEMKGDSSAAGFSAYNDIERVWAFLSRVILAHHLAGEKPPAEQTNLSEEERSAKK